MEAKLKCAAMANRCFTSLVWCSRYFKTGKMTVETKSGIKTIEITLENDEPVLFKVDMGTSTFKTPEIQWHLTWMNF